jgi:hypothetical protein
MSAKPDPNADKNDFIDQCRSIRAEIKSTAQTVWAKRMHPVLQVRIVNVATDIESKSETDANLVLAYRHLEDAAMRLGKAIQAIDGGKSVYDKKEA